MNKGGEVPGLLVQPCRNITSNAHKILFPCGVFPVTQPGEQDDLLFRSPSPLEAHWAGVTQHYNCIFISLMSSSGINVLGNRNWVLMLTSPESSWALGTSRFQTSLMNERKMCPWLDLHQAQCRTPFPVHSPSRNAKDRENHHQNPRTTWRALVAYVKCLKSTFYYKNRPLKCEVTPSGCRLTKDIKGSFERTLQWEEWVKILI